MTMAAPTIRLPSRATSSVAAGSASKVCNRNATRPTRAVYGLRLERQPEQGGIRGGRCDDDEERSPQQHGHARDRKRGHAHVQHQPVAGREREDRDQRGEQRDWQKWDGALDTRILQPRLRQRDAGQLQPVAGCARDQQSSPEHQCAPPRNTPRKATSVATINSRMPAGTNGSTTSATTPAPNAMAIGSRARRRGASSARNAAGGAASRPRALGSGMAWVASAPASVPRFHSVKRARPVAQKANRASGGESRAIAI